MIAVDWGTTSFRAYLLDEDGTPVDSISQSGGGLLSMKGPEAFDEALEEHLVGPQWKVELPVYICGMAGSRNGWVEVPYATCPANAAAIAAGIKTMQSTTGRTVYMIPGCCCKNPGYTAPDVMRGEEVQLIGAATMTDAKLFCLPGTHSKWATMRDGTITSFGTHMTGEVFAHLMEHSILGGSTRNLPKVGEADSTDMAVFTLGLQLAKQSMGTGDGLLCHLFTARTNELAGVLRADQVKSYVSGLLIGHELVGVLNSGGVKPGAAVCIIGTSTLASLYTYACQQFRMVASSVDGGAVVRAGVLCIQQAVVGSSTTVVDVAVGSSEGAGAGADRGEACERLVEHLQNCPLVAILRGLKPVECVEIGEALLAEGITLIEVPLNSPDPYMSIGQMSTALNDRAMVGAGTVLTVEQVDAVAKAGGQLIVSPNCNLDVIKHTKALGLVSIPGVVTPTEAFAALEAGADAIKLFPSTLVSPAILKAMRAVLPKDVICLPVGGVNTDNMETYWSHGATAFGIGSALYKPGVTADQVKVRAQQFLDVVKKFKAKAK